MPRQFNLRGFLEDTVLPALATLHEPRSGVVLGVDEGLNSKAVVQPMLTRLVSQGTVSMVTPLWYQTRVLGDGTRMNALGGVDRDSTLLPDIGRPPRPASTWPDEGVIAQLVSYFIQYDRLCLLTENIKNDQAGLRRILHDEVAPVLADHSPRRLGLVVLAKKPGTTLEQYCGAVEDWFHSSRVEVGFTWELLPNERGA